MQFVPLHRPHIRAEVDAVDKVAPVGALQAIITPPVHTQAEAGVVLAPAKAGLRVAHAVLPRRDTSAQAQSVRRVASHDVDHTQKSTRTVGRRVGTPQNLDAFNVGNGHGLQAWCHTAKQER